MHVEDKIPIYTFFRIGKSIESGQFIDNLDQMKTLAPVQRKSRGQPLALYFNTLWKA